MYLVAIQEQALCARLENAFARPSHREHFAVIGNIVQGQVIGFSFEFNNLIVNELLIENDQRYVEGWQRNIRLTHGHGDNSGQENAQ